MIWDFSLFHDKVAITTENGEHISYTQLQEIGNSICANFPRRCLVLCLCKNSPGSVLGYLSFLNYGIVPLLIDARTNPEFILDHIKKWRPSFLWIPAKMQSDFPYPTVSEAKDYCLLSTGQSNPWSFYEELALLLSTSGSTGNAKLVRLSYRNILSNIHSIVKCLEIKSEDKAITTMPMHYAYGLSIIHTHLYTGASILLTQKSPVTKEFWNLVKTHQVTSISGVPILYNLLRKLDLSNKDLTSVRVFTQAGGKLSSKIQKEFADKTKQQDRKFYMMYGQTEATARISYLPCEDVLWKIGSIGIPIAGGRIELMDENGILIKGAMQKGELVYWGDNVCLGYAYNGDDLERGNDNKGVLSTGDIGWRDHDGYFYIAGRKDRFVKIAGNRVGLDELENLLISKFPNIECACTGIDDHIELFFSGDLTIAQIKDYIVKSTRLPSSAFSLLQIPAIPRSKSGKTLYPLLHSANG